MNPLTIETSKSGVNHYLNDQLDVSLTKNVVANLNKKLDAKLDNSAWESSFIEVNPWR